VNANLGSERDVRDGFVGIVLQLEGRLVLELLENDTHHTVNAPDGIDEIYKQRVILRLATRLVTAYGRVTAFGRVTASMNTYGKGRSCSASASMSSGL
jgi:hypothetical protein